jgi:nucleoside phosphorylase
MQLICSAVIEELEPLLQASVFSQVAPAIYIHRQRPVLVAALGVGLVDFACGFQALLGNYQVDEALLTGTCGVYPDAFRQWSIGTLVSPLKISLGDQAEVDQTGYFPAPIIKTCLLDENFSFRLVPGVDMNCLTLTTITSNDQAAVRIERHYQAHFEQMEAYAFARLCQRQKISGAVLFAVANQVGCDGHQQWRDNARQGACQCATLLCEKFDLA